MTATVLIVDDDEAIRGLLRACIARVGYAVDEAEDGVVALKRLREHTYQVVLLDLMMPRLNGWEVLAALRAEDPGRMACVIVLSAALPKHDLEAGDRDRVFAVLAKPFDLEELRRTVVRCVAQHSPAG